MNDPLSGLASSISTPLNLVHSTEFEPDLFLDGDRFMTYLNKNYTMFDVMTYSCSKAFREPLKNVDRLIYGIKQRSTSITPKRKKFMMNNHVKLFICYPKDEPQQTEVFVGSQNLTHGTNLNLMYRVRPIHVPALVSFFETLWKSL